MKHSLLATGLLASLLSSAAALAATFSDVPDDHVHADAIEYVKSKGIVSGYADGTFRPDKNINRAEFVRIIGATLPEAGVECPGSSFQDVPVDSWFAVWVCIAKNRSLIGGYPDGTFRPGQFINFAEAAKMIVGTFGIPIMNGVTWYEGYGRALAEHGAIPYTIRSFDQLITRGEMAEMIYRLASGKTTLPSRTSDLKGVQQNARKGFASDAYRFGSTINNTQCTWKTLGPNDPQQKLNAGTQNSGMQPPSYETYAFYCEDTYAPDFTVHVFHPTDKRLDTGFVLDGQCGSQLAYHTSINRQVRRGALLYLERQQLFEEKGGYVQADHCFKNKYGNVITIRFEVAATKISRLLPQIQKAVATFTQPDVNASGVSLY